MSILDDAAVWILRRAAARAPATPVQQVPRAPAPPSFQPDSFDLTVARDQVVIPASLANPVESVSVLQLPAGAVGVFIRFSYGAVPIPLLEQGKVFELDPPSREGIFISNAVGAGTLILGASYAKP